MMLSRDRGSKASVKRIRILTLLCSSCFCFGQIAQAQRVSGSATVDIDPVSGLVIATCETDVDAPTQAFYEASVECVVRDSSGKELARGRFQDKNGAQGYAQVVLTVDGVPGSTYTVNAQHDLEIILSYSESPFDPPSGATFFDPFDFSRLDKLHETYNNLYEWFGVLPETRLQR